MESLDWTQLAGNVVPDTGRIPYEPNKHLFRKVAFDVFQLSSSPVESLWALEDGEDGEQFLVAQYSDEDTDTETLESKSHWEALSDREGKNVTLTYKTTAIQRFASTDHGFGEEDVHLFQQALIEKLASDKEFVSKLLQSQPKAKLDLLVSQFPELQALAVEKKKVVNAADQRWSEWDPGVIGPAQDDRQESEPQEGASNGADQELLDFAANVMSTAFYKTLNRLEEEGDVKFSDLEKKYILRMVAEELGL